MCRFVRCFDVISIETVSEVDIEWPLPLLRQPIAISLDFDVMLKYTTMS